ncbi:hypothetical protein EXIGLDRAFT_730949 [Exidia glandulosa HHB12029]|uniref:Uncharacterized protein n=1 Tax=Exidia glandulosa HHB12029 TaxID=1314781 RepID=A0A165PYL4_EXIGL|nr:hypothetical protein EXIGLDRAFT_730949 [Exidia glandulosa HHB12029]
MASAALVYPNGNVDIESLMWEMRDLVRGLSQINKAQAAEIERLGGQAASAALALEFSERTNAALAACDVALESWDSESDASTQFDTTNIAAWVKATNESLGLFVSTSDAPVPASDAGVVVVDVDAAEPVSATAAEVPADFWNANTTFKWEDEPLVPEEHIPELWLDDGSSDASTPRALSFDDGATLYHPDHEPASPTLARRRYTLLAAHKAETLAMDKQHAFGFGFGFDEEYDAPDVQFFPLAPVPPTRSIARRSSAPDLRLLRGRMSNIALDRPAIALVM